MTMQHSHVLGDIAGCEICDPKELSFSEWMDHWKDEIKKTQEFTKSNLPVLAGQIQDDLNRTTRDYPRMAELLADVENYLVTTRAAETLDVGRHKDFADLTAPERKTAVEGRLAPILRARDILKATVRALEQRSFALLNQRNYEKQHMRMSLNTGE